jgi:hypothetical protein
MLLLDERRAVAAIPAMLASDARLAAHMAANLERLVAAVAPHSDLARSRLAEVDTFFKTDELRHPPGSQEVRTARDGRM